MAVRVHILPGGVIPGAGHNLARRQNETPLKNLDTMTTARNDNGYSPPFKKINKTTASAPCLDKLKTNKNLKPKLLKLSLTRVSTRVKGEKKGVVSSPDNKKMQNNSATDTNGKREIQEDIFVYNISRSTELPVHKTCIHKDIKPRDTKHG